MVRLAVDGCCGRDAYAGGDDLVNTDLNFQPGCSPCFSHDLWVYRSVRFAFAMIYECTIPFQGG